ncbi:MAG: hypothetical protein ACOCU6_02890 [Nanoarchaeota archaeon]
MTMKKRVRAVTILFVFLFLIMLSPMVFAEQRSIVVSNTYDWKEIFITSIYASINDADYFYHLNDFSDANMKKNMMTKDDSIAVFESNEQAVVKNFGSSMGVKGYGKIDTYSYDSLEDLQRMVFDMVDPKGFVVFGTEFGVEPISAISYLNENEYLPLFYTNRTSEYLATISDEKRDIYVGRIPLREVDIDDAETYIGGPVESSLDMMSLASTESDETWGIITRIDNIDFQSLQGKRPVFLFFGMPYMQEVSDIAYESSIIHYEVIGGDTVDIAQEMESQMGRDIKLMLKYGRKITNYGPVSDDAVLEIDSIELPRPVERLEIEDAIIYPRLGRLLVTYHNIGNVDELFYSTYDFGESSFSDDSVHHIPAGEKLSFSYDIFSTHDDYGILTITSEYGHTLPLSINMEENGSQLLERNVSINSYSGDPNLYIQDVVLDTSSGVVEIKVKNNHTQPLNYFVEMELINDSIVRSSTQDTISSKQHQLIKIPFKYTADDVLLNKTANMTVYYGPEDTVHESHFALKISEKQGIMGVTEIIIGVTVIVALVVMALVFFIHKKRHRELERIRKHHHKRLKKKKN